MPGDRFKGRQPIQIDSEAIVDGSLFPDMSCSQAGKQVNLFLFQGISRGDAVLLLFHFTAPSFPHEDDCPVRTHPEVRERVVDFLNPQA